MQGFVSNLLVAIKYDRLKIILGHRAIAVLNKYKLVTCASYSWNALANLRRKTFEL